jgi:hypothetical protein
VDCLADSVDGPLVRFAGDTRSVVLLRDAFDLLAAVRAADLSASSTVLMLCSSLGDVPGCGMWSIRSSLA